MTTKATEAKATITPKPKPCKSPEGHGWRQTMVIDYGLDPDAHQSAVTYHCDRCGQTVTVR